MSIKIEVVGNGWLSMYDGEHLFPASSIRRVVVSRGKQKQADETYLDGFDVWVDFELSSPRQVIVAFEKELEDAKRVAREIVEKAGLAQKDSVK